jgi:hypothetical protein
MTSSPTMASSVRPHQPAPSSGDLFGLTLRASMPVDGLTTLDERPSRSVDMDVSVGPAARDRGPHGEEVYSAAAHGRTALAIDRRPDGYSVWGRRHGRFVVSTDGTHIAAEVPAERRWPWRLLLAQALPIAATLQGLEVLHASAVVVDGRGVAVTGQSGAGKTTLALELVKRGADFLADDVLAIEAAGGGVTAHPGVGIVNVDDELLRRGLPAHRLVARTVKRHVLVSRWPAPVPLERLYVLGRGGDGDEPEIDRLAPPDPRILLGSTFVFVVGGAERLVRQLDIHRAIAETVSVYRVLAPRGCTPALLASALERHMSTEDR